MLAGEPEIFDIFKEFIFKTVLLAAEFTTMSAAEVPTACTAVFPKIDVTFTIFGFAIITSCLLYYPPKTIDMAIAFPVEVFVFICV